MTSTALSSAVLGVEASVCASRWVFRAEDDRVILALQQRFGVPEALARILVGRGIGLEDAQDFLQPSLKSSLPDPLHFKDMDKAVERLLRAVQHNEKIGIFGDYDVDGATSSALLVRYFRALDIITFVHIPDRHSEGYGPNFPAIAALHNKGCGVIITVDCGATAFESLKAAADAGIEVVVIDHHMGSAALPDAVAVVNPNRLDETTSHRYLAAVGVVFMTLIGLNRALREIGYFVDGKKEPNLMAWLDIVALGTVCDVVPLVGANRALVAQGLKVMQVRGNAGIRTLIDKAGVTDALTTYHAGFAIGPRINAGGRVGHASYGSRILSSEDEVEVRELADALDTYNLERKAIEMMVQEEAFSLAECVENNPVILVYSSHWHQGVIGIVAGRLKDHFHKPVAVLTREGDVVKASARSIAGVDLGAAIVAARSQGLLLAGGGHAMAAGFSLIEERIPMLQAFLNEQLGTAVRKAHEYRTLKLDGVLSVSGATVGLVKSLCRGAPYGVGNPTPKFALASVRITRLDILKDTHIKLQIAPAEGKGQWMKAIAFRAVGTPLGELLMSAQYKPLHLAGQLNLDVWQGKESVSLHIEDAAFTI